MARGPGRPRLANPRRPLTARLRPALINRIDDLVDEQGTSRSEVVEQLVAQALGVTVEGEQLETPAIETADEFIKRRTRQLRAAGLTSLVAKRMAKRELARRDGDAD